uniref:Uncharacterized protein n=1 Tax=Rhizophora mucronata TaxID=61149 RepID=A0A2P2IYY7_RHIMU
MSSNSSTGSNNHGSQQSQGHHQLGDRSVAYYTSTVSLVAKSLLPTRRRLRLDPPTKLFFPCKLVCVLFLFFLLVFMVSFHSWIYYIPWLINLEFGRRLVAFSQMLDLVL